MKIDNLSFSYNEDNQIFSNFCFSSDQKHIFFEGYSGSGKSTLLKLLTGNLEADEGSITFGDGVGERVCLVLQEDGLFPWLSGINNILSVVSGSTSEQVASSLLFEYTKDFIFKKAFEMSFGQRRLIELLRASLLQPTFLCLDEPFNYLDERSRQIVSKILFAEYSFAKTKQIVMTTHYRSDISNLVQNGQSTYFFNGITPYERLEERK